MAIRHTDVLIIGGELSGAVAAAVCARAGRRVVVLEEGEGADDVAVGGVLVPPVDDLWPNLDGLARAKGVLEALAMHGELRRIMPLSDVSVQVLHPEHRLDLFAEPARRKADLLREAGEAGAQAASRLDEDVQEERLASAVVDTVDPLTDVGFFATRRVKGAYRDAYTPVKTSRALEHGADVDWLRAGLGGALAFLSNGASPPPAVQSRLVRALLMGVHVSPVGGRAALRQLLLDAAKQRGAEIIRDERVAALVVDSGRISEVRMGGRGEARSAKVIVDATWSRDLGERVSPEKHAKRLEQAMGSVQPERVRAAVAWVVKKEGVPPGLGERAILHADGEGPGSEPALLLCERQPVHPETRKVVPGLSVISASVPVAPGDVDAACARLSARLDALLPFTRKHLVEARNLGAARLEASRTAIYRGPEEPMELGGRGLEGGLKGLLRAGRDVAPALGVEGELWAGHAAAIWAEKMLSRKPLFGGQADESPSGPR
ncbi:MAG: hypothetical protein AB2A00_30825 [Myxococcota bacterium]